MPQTLPTLNDPRYRIRRDISGAVQFTVIVADQVATSVTRTVVTNATLVDYMTIAEREAEVDMRHLGMRALANEWDDNEFIPDV